MIFHERFVLMNSHITSQFRACYAALPADVREHARKAYKIWKENPAHPGLNFKLVIPEMRVYSVRIGRSHRALGVLEQDTVIWYWIGNHDEYERILA